MASMPVVLPDILAAENDYNHGCQRIYSNPTVKLPELMGQFHPWCKHVYLEQALVRGVTP